ncbi:hypothetical protein OOT46_28100 [Aquabacterium sp. A7-Y]|uniref:hypothetical protein n=1 Tax=Aquabacterium sp. A7-Y TaxID=1349605 RepID=UPI00223CA1DC|nr:hypothetical protein [Aquabacterium sp. A7-Y]MCW7541665.1 hypothetical protein [Aquabacterium sp. A7-Y]
MSTTQQEFLRQAMADLGELIDLGRSLTREEMCERLGCPRATFDKWMLPSSNGREMPPTMWSHVREILAHEQLKKKMRGGA